MNRLGDARRALAATLEPVLPGRVSPHPPPAGRWVAPGIYLDQPFVNRAVIGQRSTATVATFPVWLVYDGADAAQVDGLDDLVANAWDAVVAAPGNAQPETVRAEAVQSSNGRQLRAAVMAVEVTVAAATLCAPTAAESPIPPIPQEAVDG